MLGEIVNIFDRGFGFILGQDGQEYFVHRSGLLDAKSFAALEVGDQVTFTATEAPRGPRAERVVLLDSDGNPLGRVQDTVAGSATADTSRPPAPLER